MSLFKKSKTEQSAPRLAPWKIAIIDDEEGIHEVTKLTLRKFTFEKRGVEFLSAHSGEEGLALFKAHPDIALAFVDVVFKKENEIKGLPNLPPGKKLKSPIRSLP